MNKLGFYLEVGNVAGLHTTLRELQPPVILMHSNSLNKDLLALNRRSQGPNAFVIGRWYLTNQEQDQLLDHGDPAVNGRQLAETIIKHDPFFKPATRVGENGRLLIDAWMSLNEAIAGPASGSFAENAAHFEQRLRRYDRFQVAFRARLQEEGIEAIAFNFAAGNFRTAAHYLDYFPETLATYTYLGFHEYGWPHLNPQNPDARHGPTKSGAGLYRTCLTGIRQHYGDRHQVIITELGLTKEYRDHHTFERDARDDGLGDLGWLNHTQTLDEAFYFDSLRWYNALINQDDYVLGACLYEVGHSGRFAGHRHLGKDNQGNPLTIMQRMRSLQQPAVPVSSGRRDTPPKVAIRGTVTLEGEAVAGARVYLLSDPATLRRLRRTNRQVVTRSAAASQVYSLLTTTDANGEFSFPQLPPGEYQLEVAAPLVEHYLTAFSLSAPVDLAVALQRTPPRLAAQQISTHRRIHCGINIDPRNGTGNPSGQAVSELGASWVRLVFKNERDEALGTSFAQYDAVVNDMRQAGVKVLMILNNESCPGRPGLEALDDAAHWHPYIDQYTQRCQAVAQHYGEQVAAFQIWNEPDLNPEPPRYTPTVRARFYGRMLQQAYQAIKAVTTTPVVTAGMAAGNPQWVKEAMAATGNQLFADALAVHPYGRRPFPTWPHDQWGFGPVAELLQRYHTLIGKPIWVTEFGTDDTTTQTRRDDGSMGPAQDLFPLQMFDAINTQVAHFVSHVFWFCWSSGMVNPFGIHEANGTRKGSYTAFQRFARLPMNGAG
ncbi:MAG: carboxypeptidase regulatory-like domain-containing protein [Caldilineaceae bacterium]|nr:carboxypeptidase regulatory-like domain-containing protein [Caldilineaceae bacterium]